MTKWVIELGEFEVKFILKITIKGQAVTNFVVEFSYPTKVFRGENTTLSTSEEQLVDNDPTNPHNVWNLRIYGSSNVNESGIGVVLESPMGEKVRYALRLQFLATNNETEYEALIAGLHLAREMGLQQLRIYSDSQLVVNQVRGDY